MGSGVCSFEWSAFRLGEGVQRFDWGRVSISFFVLPDWSAVSIGGGCPFLFLYASGLECVSIGGGCVKNTYT